MTNAPFKVGIWIGFNEGIHGANATLFVSFGRCIRGGMKISFFISNENRSITALCNSRCVLRGPSYADVVLKI